MEENSVENMSTAKKDDCCPKCKCKNIKYTALQKKAAICRILFLIAASALLLIISLNLYIFGLTENPSEANSENSYNVETLAGDLEPPPGFGEDNDPYDEEAAAGLSIILLSLACITIKVVQYALESKVYVQAICLDCRHTWTVSSPSIFE